MRHLLKLISLLLLLIVVLTSVEGYCGDSGSGKSTRGNHCCDHGTQHSDRTVPHGDFGGCGACASCPCHAPLPVFPTLPAFVPVVVVRPAFEISKAIPEVYLSKFIPPQNA